MGRNYSKHGVQRAQFRTGQIITRRAPSAKQETLPFLLPRIRNGTRNFQSFLRFTLSPTETDDDYHMAREGFWNFRVADQPRIALPMLAPRIVTQDQ
ncbi:unnamed protein product [Penicillium camemberti]|uniref:Str. FM013 n=1 Tax=Penicillium camemberti (strain FM 013) TaxID=1429867 RepID=A0A0G4PM12_PENC3|nr:unnamed protein product [Penicillium camemberti]